MTPQTRSIWLDTAPETSYPALAPGLSVDVAVLGGGIAGLSTALMLAREGHSVAVVEASRIATGVTGHTTGKFTQLHGLIYQDLISSHGVEAARGHAQANAEALDWIAEFAGTPDADFDFDRMPAATYATDESSLRKVEREVEATGQAGVDAVFAQDLDLPFAIRGAVHLENQIRLHPRRLCLALAEATIAEGGHVFETTRATHVDETSAGCTVRTEAGDITAGHVVVATNLPFLDRGVLFAKAHPHRGYAIAARVGSVPAGMYISASQPSRSLRPVTVDGEELLILGGESHTPGTGSNRGEHFDRLETFARDHFALASVDWRWSTQDYFPVDHLPLIGRNTPRTERVYAATGFRGWGLAQGVAAGILLADLIAGRENPWAELYDPHRATPRASAVKFVKENTVIGARFVGDRVLKRSNPRCTHLGCVLGFNDAEQTWDCPCHGSRFALDGTVLQGPAVKPLDLSEHQFRPEGSVRSSP